MPDTEYQRSNDAHIEVIKADVAVLKEDVAEIKAGAATAAGTVAGLHSDMKDVKISLENTQRWVEDNSAVSRDNAATLTTIKDILTSFRIGGAISKWLTRVVIASAALYAAIKGWANK